MPFWACNFCTKEAINSSAIDNHREIFSGGGQKTSTPNDQENTDTADSAKEPEKIPNAENDSPEKDIEAEATSDPTLASSAETDLSKEKILDEEVETVLGADPTVGNKKDLDLHPSLVAKWPA